MRSQRLADIGEGGWLERLISKLHRSGGSFATVPIGDDAAVFVPLQEKQIVLTCDGQSEGTHFSREWLDWGGLARRSVLAAASDVTAMGGEPRGFLLSLGIPAETLLEDLELFTDALSELAQEANIAPLGGDTVRSDKIWVDCAVAGFVGAEDLLLQEGAEAGDALWVTGDLGRMRAAWMAQMDRREGEERVRSFFWNPPMRWNLLPALREKMPLRALTDLSDGLGKDLKKILKKGDLGATIELTGLPVDESVREFAAVRGLDPYETAFLGGEDFELLIVEKEDSLLSGKFDLGGIALTKIGRVEKNGVKILYDGKEHLIEASSFEHFSRTSDR